MAPTPGSKGSTSGVVGKPVASSSGDSALAIRYGRTRSVKRRRFVIALVVGVAFAVVFGAWVIFAAFDGTSASVDTNDAGYVIHDKYSASVTSEVSVDPGTKVDCSVEVLNAGFDIVGWKVIHLAPSTQSSNTYVTDIKTTNRGVTGLIDKCWLP